jgi:hypothetical protein
MWKKPTLLPKVKNCTKFCISLSFLYQEGWLSIQKHVSELGADFTNWVQMVLTVANIAHFRMLVPISGSFME